MPIATTMLNHIFLIWLTDAASWSPRHAQCVQSIVHTNPAANVVLYTNTLTQADAGPGVRIAAFEIDEIALGTPLWVLVTPASTDADACALWLEIASDYRRAG